MPNLGAPSLLRSRSPCRFFLALSRRARRPLKCERPVNGQEDNTKEQLFGNCVIVGRRCTALGIRVSGFRMDGASSHPSECSSNISLARNIRPEIHSTVARSSNWKHMSRAMSTASSLCKMNTRTSSLTISSADAFNIVLRIPPRWPPAHQRTTEDQLFGNPRESSSFADFLSLPRDTVLL
ncbi:hypothetical protein L5515_015904 [Caenorhabditis briggsae]|uniref:Uncharacterized protein n=1 Tax=Caenorhabditis briggsae TaxID=6238 RepID=A0AAE9ECW8_CAEBR|nr:hypothetical protein L5515_015904 [Caenorhabditis briggsae]